MATDFESARRKYRPRTIEYLFVAEAPPREGSRRFFYFEDVTTGDSLFLETMKVLYPEDYSETKIVRLQKRRFLKRFQEDGFYLIDSTDKPMEDSRSAKKRKQIAKALPSLQRKLKRLATGDTKIILISATVYEVCAGELKSAGCNVVNSGMIDFPGSGGQAKYKDKLGRLLRRLGWRAPASGAERR